MRSTGETDLKRAKIKCQAMVRIAEEESRADTDRDLLVRIVNDTLRRLGHTPIESPTIRVYLEEWLANERQSVSESTYVKYEQVIRDFLAGVGSDRKLASITEADIIRHRDHLQAGGRSPSTVNLSIRTILKRPFRIAVDKGLIQRNPVALVRPIREANGNGGHKGTFTPEQIRAILAVASTEWQGMVLMGFYTGARLMDLATIKWASIDLTERLVTILQGKTGKEIRIPIHPELEAWLLANGGNREAGHVFPTVAKQSLSGTSGLSMQFRKLMSAAGIDRGEIRSGHGEGHSVSALSFHSLRHSFNTLLANQGVAQELRQKLTGHTSSRVNDGYTHLALESLRSAIRLLPPVGN